MSRSSSASRSSSSSGSSSPSPSPPSSPVLLGSFDPFAVHPFTNYSGPTQSSSTSRNNKSGGVPGSPHLLPHPSTLNQYDSQVPSGPNYASSHPYHYNPNGIAQPNAIPATPGYGNQGSQTHAGGAYKPIFVPFRQDTSSPDLSDVLRRKRMGL